jgi:hypothetical protein
MTFGWSPIDFNQHFQANISAALHLVKSLLPAFSGERDSLGAVDGRKIQYSFLAR